MQLRNRQVQLRYSGPPSASPIWVPIPPPDEGGKWYLDRWRIDGYASGDTSSVDITTSIWDAEEETDPSGVEADLYWVPIYDISGFPQFFSGDRSIQLPFNRGLMVVLNNVQIGGVTQLEFTVQLFLIQTAWESADPATTQISLP
jgi:hypothetical protein